MNARDYAIVEFSCLLIIVQYVTMRLRRDARGEERHGQVLARFALLALGGWIAEDAAMHLFNFYQYNPLFWPTLDRMPLLIALIWPVVIHSAWDLARALLGEGHRLVAPLAATFVLADASLIEPVAVRAGLWSWNAPGLFAVPPIGVLGWAFFTLIAVATLAKTPPRGPRGVLLLVPLIAPIAVQPGLVAAWWGLFRWINVTVPPWPLVAIAWVLSITSALFLFRRGLRHRVPRAQMFSRIPAALFFFVLLGLFGHNDPALIAWTFAFAPPYLALTAFRPAAR